MKKRAFLGRRGHVVFWAGVVLWLAFFAEHVDVWQGHELISLEYLSRLTRPQDLDQQSIVFVSIDRSDVKTLFKGDSHPQPNKVMATIKSIALAEPKVIVVAIATTDSEYSQMSTNLPYRCQKLTSENPRTEVPKTSAQENKTAEKIKVPCVPIVWASEPASPDPPFSPDSPVVPGVVLGGSENPEEPSAAGISSLFTDDGAVRRYKWVFETKDGHYADSLALAVLKIIRQAHISQPPRLNEECQVLGRGSNDCLRPAFIRYSMGEPHRIFTFQDLETLSKTKPISMKDPAISPHEDWKQWLAGKIVFVGGEFPDGRDHYQTPAGDLYSVRIHAEALASELAKNTIWVRSRCVVIPSEIAALCILFFLQHWIKRLSVRLWIIFLGMLALSIALSYVAFDTSAALNTWFASLNFIPLLAAIFLDVVKDFAAERMSAS